MLMAVATRRKTAPTPVGLDAESLDLAENYTYCPEPVRRARETAITTLGNGTCAVLTFVAAALDARMVVEIGTRAGVTGLAMFAGMSPDGVLTSIDFDTDGQNTARERFTEAHVSPNRYRLISGVALDVLPKLRDAAYDIVLISGDKLEYVEYVAQAVRLLRPGGALLMIDALLDNKVADPRNEDDEAIIIREALEVVRQDDAFTSVLVPLGNGVLAAINR